MNAIKLLESQHDQVEELLKKAERTRNAETRQRLFQQIADALAVHATIEEKIFYPAVMAKATETILLESVEEHLAIKRVIADLLVLGPDDRSYLAKLIVLKDEVLGHVKEERSELFPKAKKLLDKDDLEELGKRMEELAEKLEHGTPRDAVPLETSHPAELPGF